MPPLPLPRFNAGPAIEVDGKIAVFGGRTRPPGEPGRIDDTIILYDIAAATWGVADVTLAPGLASSYPLEFGPNVLLVGGAAVAGQQATL